MRRLVLLAGHQTVDWIVFDSHVPGKPQPLYLVDPATSLPRQISTKGIIRPLIPSWCADGKWIYFHSESLEPAERDALYRVSAQGKAS